MNKPLAYIEKTLKATVSLSAAFALVAGSLMVCCMTQSAQASMPMKMSGHCHHAMADQKSDHSSKTCDCCKIRPSDSDMLVKLFDALPSFAKTFQAFVAEAFVYTPHAPVVHLAYTGPPRGQPSVPIYLQISCLRL